MTLVGIYNNISKALLKVNHAQYCAWTTKCGSDNFPTHMIILVCSVAYECKTCYLVCVTYVAVNSILSLCALFSLHEAIFSLPCSAAV